MDNPSTTTYGAAGRYSIRHNTIGFALSEYKGFFAIPMAFSINFVQSQASSATTPDGTATAQPQGGVASFSYQWDAAANNQTTATATGLLPGDYCVTITDNDGCENANCVTVLLNTPTTLIEASKGNVQLYPNPAHYNLNLKIEGIEGEKTIEVFDALGQLIYSEVIQENKAVISVEHWTSGMYLLRLKTKEGLVKAKKFVVKD